MEEVGYDEPMMNKSMRTQEEKINNINNNEIINMIENYVLDELVRIEKYISDENIALSKTPEVIENDELKISEKSMILGSSRNDLELNQYGRYNFEMKDDCIKAHTYAFGKRLSHHFMFEDNNNKTKLGEQYEKVLNDLLFYNLPDSVKKEHIRKQKLNNLI